MTMTSIFDTAITSLYLAYYGRPADSAGLAFWSQQLAQSNGDIAVISSAFGESAEAQSYFTSTDVAGRITQIYQEMFGRAPEAEGLGYWRAAVDAGHCSLTDVALAVMQGAQGTDLTLANARSVASEAFTAAAALAGTDYSGAAAVGVGRLLIQAVKMDTSSIDIQKMVQAAVSLADVASTTPAVVDALDGNGSLSAMLATTQGAAHPVELLQTLARTAAIAAGDPATLAQLLRGGGMPQVLAVMPASASLVDVADALQSGGLSAAIDVVYPSVVATPSSAVHTPPALVLTSVQDNTGSILVTHDGGTTDDTTLVLQGTLGSATAGAGLGGGQTIRVHDGATYLGDATVTQLANGQSTWTYADTRHLLDGQSVSYTAQLAAGNVDLGKPTAAFDLTIDTTAPTDGISIMGVASGADTKPAFDIALTATDASVGDRVALYVDGVAAGSRTLSSADIAHGSVTVALAASSDGIKNVTAKLVDAAGNESAASANFVYTLDTTAPVINGLAFSQVIQGAGDSRFDNVTNVAVASVDFSYVGADLAAGEQFEYSLDGGPWSTAGITVFTSTNTVRVTGVDLRKGVAVGDNTSTLVQLRATDAAGNTTPVASKQIIHDPLARALNIQLDVDTAGQNTSGTTSDGVTRVGTYTVSGIEAGARVEYSVNGSTGWTATAPATVGGLNAFHVRQIDEAGNISATTSFSFTLDTTAPIAPTVALLADTGVSSTDLLTNSGLVQITNLAGDGATVWEYSTNAGASWTSGGTTLTGTAQLHLGQLGDGATSVIVRQTDIAGNRSAASLPLEFTLDTTGPSGHALRFSAVEQATTDANITTLEYANVYFQYDGTLAADTLLQWRLAGGSWTSVNASAINADTHTVIVGPLDLRASDPVVELRVTDAAGNVGGMVSQLIDGPYSFEMSAQENYAGISVTSSAAGRIFLVDALDPSHETRVLSTNGGDAVNGTVIVGRQDVAATGYVKVVTEGGGSGIDKALIFGLGTDAAESLSGQYVWGFGGDDELTGTDGADYLIGGAGVDLLIGGKGNDKLAGEGGADILTGGEGADIFVFKALADSVEAVNGGTGFDVITDFQAVGMDKIDLSAAGFVAHPQNGFTASSTVHATLESLVSQADNFLQNYTVYGSVFIGQVGSDVYILGENHTPVAHEYTAGADLIIKLENVLVADITLDDFIGLSGTVHLIGTDTVPQSGWN